MIQLSRKHHRLVDEGKVEAPTFLLLVVVQLLMLNFTVSEILCPQIALTFSFSVLPDLQKHFGSLPLLLDFR